MPARGTPDPQHLSLIEAYLAGDGDAIAIVDTGLRAFHTLSLIQSQPDLDQAALLQGCDDAVENAAEALERALRNGWLSSDA